MKIILVYAVSLNIAKEDGSSFVSLFKTVYSNIRPCKGDIIEDPLFRNYPHDYSVVKVSINYTANECYVTLRVLELETDDTNCLTEYVKNAKLHGWTIDRNT